MFVVWGGTELKLKVCTATNILLLFCLFRQDKTHVMAGIETKNADATVAALGTDTVYTLLAPAGITVAPGSVKAYLGSPVVPTTDGSGSTSADASGSGSSGSSSSGGGGGSNTGAIVGAVVGVVVGLGALGGGFWVS